MEISGCYKYSIPDRENPSNLGALLQQLRSRMTESDDADLSLIDDPELPPTYSDHPEVVELFLFVPPVRQAADTVEVLLAKVIETHDEKRGLRILLPSYPFKKSRF